MPALWPTYEWCNPFISWIERWHFRSFLSCTTNAPLTSKDVNLIPGGLNSLNIDIPGYSGIFRVSYSWLFRVAYSSVNVGNIKQSLIRSCKMAFLFECFAPPGLANFHFAEVLSRGTRHFRCQRWASLCPDRWAGHGGIQSTEPVFAGPVNERASGLLKNIGHQWFKKVQRFLCLVLLLDNMLPDFYFSIILLRVPVDTGAAHVHKTGIRHFCLVLLCYLVKDCICSITHPANDVERTSWIHYPLF